MLVHDQSGNPLSRRTIHDTGLAWMKRKAFVAYDGFYQAEKRRNFSPEIVIAGKRQVISIARISGSESRCQFIEAIVEVPC